jgi:hypothetical protein
LYFINDIGYSKADFEDLSPYEVVFLSGIYQKKLKEEQENVKEQYRKQGIPYN